ncbi:MAG: hypothetical protein MUD11_05485, partial [Rhodobacteraceae bacterium]|nr:hypothetical protein [Paracoccaceae bacterium]
MIWIKPIQKYECDSGNWYRDFCGQPPVSWAAQVVSGGARLIGSSHRSPGMNANDHSGMQIVPARMASAVRRISP